MTPINAGELAALLGPDYELSSLLGQGGYGTVFKAIRRCDGEFVAIKVQSTSLEDEEAVAVRRGRFEREARLCAALDHPNIVRLLHKGLCGRYFYLVFEFVPGETLSQVLLRRGALPIAEAVALMAQVLEALEVAHARGIVHRDLKPDNLMVVDGERAQVKVLDFGVAGLLRGGLEAAPTLTRSREILGTPSYSAPEQLRGEVATSRSDLYAWGLVLLECLTGERAIDGATMAQVFHKQLSPLDVPLPQALAAHPLGALLRRALAKSPRARACDAGRLLTELREIPSTELVGSLRSERLSMAPTVSLDTDQKPGEQRQATVLSCSLDVIRTEHARADVEMLDALQRDQLKLAEDVAARHGGYTVGMLASRCVVAFGLPQASESDARRAGRAALELATLTIARQAGLLAQHGVELEFRIGIHTDVLLLDADGTPSGPAINAAARLEASAFPCTILVSKATRSLFDKRWHLVPEAGVIPRAGVPGGELFRLIVTQNTEYLPEVGAEAVEVVGRDNELEALLSVWAKARAGSGALVVLRGEAGIGKTRLAREIEVRARLMGAATYHFQCAPEDSNSALKPILNLFRGSALSDQDLAADVETPSVLSSWVHGLESRSRVAVSAERQRELLLASLAKHLCSGRVNGPRLVLIEDLQWVDPTTRELLVQMAQMSATNPVMLLVTTRLQSDFDASASFVLDLKGLDTSSVARLVEMAAPGASFTENELRQIVERTDGIPLFVEELTRELLQRREPSTPLWSTGSVPQGLRDLLHGRLDRLGAAKETAQLASAIGRDFEVSLLHSISPRDPAAISADLALLLEAQIVQAADGAKPSLYHFRHALIRETAWDSMLPARRRTVHARLATVLEARGVSSGHFDHAHLAWHFELAGELDKAMEHRAIAGHAAASSSAYQEAIDHYQVALRLNTEATASAARKSREIDLRNALGAVLIGTQGFATPLVLDTFTRAEALLGECQPTTKQRFTSLKGLWTFHNARANYPTARRLTDELFSLARQEDVADFYMAAHECAAQTSLLTGLYAETMRVGSSCDQWYSVELQREQAARYGLDPWLATLSFEAIALALVGRLSRAEARLRQGQATLAGLSSPSHEASFLGQSAMVEFMLGSVGPRPNAALARCVEQATRAVELAQRFGLRFAEGYGQLLLAMATAPGGHAPSVAGLEQALAIWNMLGIRASVSWSLCALAQGQHALGRYEQALASASAAREHCDEFGEGHGASEVHRTLGCLLSDPASPHVQTERAREHFEKALELATGAGANWLQLRAAHSFFRRIGCKSARDQVATAVGWFMEQKEGLQTALVQDSVAILA